MLLLHHRSLLNKRPLQILLALALLCLFFIELPINPFRSPLRDYSDDSTSGYREESIFVHDQARYEAALVVASRKHENTRWLQEHFDAWRKFIYVTDDSRAELTVPVNKGREAMVYLTYIIDHYDKLEDVTIFVHAERYQWHNDDPDYDGQRLLSSLNLTQIQVQGYASLKCSWTLGCPAEIHPSRDAGKPSNPPKAGEVYKQSFQVLFPDVEVPDVVGSACCAQFAVSRDAIRNRPKADYEKYRQWILDTEIVDDLSGRVLEYAWHIIFGKEAVFCPSAKSCYCSLYGICDLKCRDRNGCEGRYVLPPFSTLPEGWPTRGWDGEARVTHEY